MSIEENVQIVKGFFAAIGSGDNQRVLALVAEDIERIVPGEDWPLAGTHRAHAGVEEVLQKASEEIEMTYPKPPEFVAQGDRVFVIGVATGKTPASHLDDAGGHGAIYHTSRLRRSSNFGVGHVLYFVTWAGTYSLRFDGWGHPKLITASRLWLRFRSLHHR